MVGKLVHEIKEGVGIITFQHPKGNSLPSGLLQNLSQTIDSYGETEEVKVIVVKSEGEGAFCAGASFHELTCITTKEEGIQFFSGFANLLNSMRKCPKLIIGRVQGKAVGGGVGFCSGFDYCMAHKNASIKLSELSIGIGPFVIAPAVKRKIGNESFAELTLRATEWKSADWALQQGLFHQVFDSTQELDEEVERFAKELSLRSAEAMRELKKIFWEGTENWDKSLYSNAKLSGELVLSDFSQKTIRKFLEK